MINRLLRWPALVFVLVFVWELLLLLATHQPVPANDSFFYDGPVVNLLLNGKYVNPSLAQALPIAATRFFSAYPPLYQGVLLPWMAMFGTSAFSAMSLHLLLLGLYLVVLLNLFRKLQLPAWCIHLAGLFLFQFTFHDRPDSLAHFLGLLAIYAWVQSRQSRKANPAGNSASWLWGMAVFNLLTFCTSLQIGAAYLMLIWLALIVSHLFAGDPLPLLPMALTVAGPAALVMLVKFGFPELWAGFLEHARQTPSLTGVRLPQAGDVLKILRTIPGAITAAFLLPFALAKMSPTTCSATSDFWLVTVACSLTVLSIAAGCLLVVTPNMIAIAGYFQPLIVGTFLACLGSSPLGEQWTRLTRVGFAALALLASVRGIGMSTWGVACARDVGYADCMDRIRQECARTTQGKRLVASAAYLYEAARCKTVQWIHSDWLIPAQKNETQAELTALATLRPEKLILTQFDYFRRYEPLLAQLQAQGGVRIEIQNTAKIPTPDSIPSVQKIVQHISWAPVIVTLTWN